MRLRHAHSPAFTPVVNGQMRRKRRANFARPGYTLMEVVVAFAIAMLLLAALYAAFFITVRQGHNGREMIHQSHIARAVITRLNEDIIGHLGPLDPRLVRLPDGLIQSDEAAAESSDTATSTTSSSTTTSSDTSSTTKSAESDPAAAPGGPALFNMGVQGGADFIMLFVSQAPARRPGNAAKMGNAEPRPVNWQDQRRISYWITENANGKPALARHVEDIPTSETALTTSPLDLPDQQKYIISDQVVNIKFEYFDGLAWAEEWDGMQPRDAEGKLPGGPPIAIAVTLEIAARDTGEIRSYRHVLSLPTANGPVDPAVTEGAITGP